MSKYVWEEICNLYLKVAKAIVHAFFFFKNITFFLFLFCRAYERASKGPIRFQLFTLNVKFALAITKHIQLDTLQNLWVRAVFMTIQLSLSFIKRQLISHKLLHSLINFAGRLAAPMIIELTYKVLIKSNSCYVQF